MLNFLSKTWVMVILFVLMMAIGYSFSFVQIGAGGALLDTLWTGEEASARLSEMTREQKDAHLWGTLMNDTIYPLAYGGLFMGLIWRFAGSLRRWFILPPIAVTITDLAENMTQAAALMGNDAFLGLKDVLTPAKFGLFALAAVLVLVSVVLAVIRRVRAD